MSGRDHSCETCGRGGFNDPDGACICPEAECPGCTNGVVSSDEGTSYYCPVHGPAPEAEAARANPLGGDCGFCGQPVDEPNGDCVGTYHPCPTCMRDLGDPAPECTDPVHRGVQPAPALEAIREGDARLPVMALRPYHDDPERLDDVVVKDVRTFRAEMMSDGTLWMACYFNDEGDGIHFWARAGKRGTAQLHLSATTVPEHTDFDAPTLSEGREE